MMLRPGQKLRSAVSDAEVVVVRAPAADVDVSCGGAHMFESGTEAPATGSLDVTTGAGPMIGKRYADDDLGIELLCTRAGEGTLAVDGRPLPIKAAKPLPASD
jgi:hypothetical protein